MKDDSKTGGLRQQIFILSRSGGLKSESRDRQGCASCQGLEGGSVACSFLLLGSLGSPRNPWHLWAGRSVATTPASSTPHLLLCLSVFPLQSLDLGPALNPGPAHLTIPDLLTSADPISSKVMFWCSRWTWILGTLFIPLQMVSCSLYLHWHTKPKCGDGTFLSSGPLWGPSLTGCVSHSFPHVFDLLSQTALKSRSPRGLRVIFSSVGCVGPSNYKLSWILYVFAP